MTNKVEHLVSLNGEYMYSSVNNVRYAPLRVDTETVQNVQNAVMLEPTDENSCISDIVSHLDNNKFVLNTHFNETTKCTKQLNNPSTRTKDEMCLRQLCNGKCTDEFMCNVVARKIFPDLYKNKQI